MQHRRAGLHVTAGSDLLTDTDIPHGFGGEQVVLEGAVIPAARHPDVAAAQPVAQRGEHRRLV